MSPFYVTKGKNTYTYHVDNAMYAEKRKQENGE